MQLNVVFEFGLHTKQGSQIRKIFRYDHPIIAACRCWRTLMFPNVQRQGLVQALPLRRLLEVYGIKEKYPRIRAPVRDRLVRRPVP